MANEQQNANQSATADNATPGETVGPLAPELGPNGIPINPQGDDQGDGVDTDFLMNTFFGDGSAEPPNSGEGQGKGSNSPDGQSGKGSLAPPSTAPAANAGEGSPQPGPSSGQQTGTEQVSGAGAAAQTPPQGQSQPSGEPQPAPQMSAEDRIKLASANALAEQNAQLLARLRMLEQGGQQPQTQGQGQQPAPTTQPGGQQEPLRLAVPEPLFQAIFDENPATSKQAIDVLVTAVAQNAVNAALKAVEPMIEQRLSAVTQQAESQKAVSKMEEDYFKSFPNHNQELYRPLIQSVVEEKYRAFPYAQWDEHMISAVGATVNEKLKAIGIDPSASQQQQQPNGQNGQGQPQANGGHRPKPAPMLDGSTRANGDKVPHDTGDFIRNTFG